MTSCSIAKVFTAVLRNMTAGLAITTSLLLALKLLEMVVHVRWFLRLDPADYSLVRRTLATWKRKGFLAGAGARASHKHIRLWSPEYWPITQHLIGPGRLYRLRRLILRGLFRWPYLMCLQVIAVITISSRFLILTGSILLVLGIWIEIMQRFVFRLRLGPADSYFRRAAILRLHSYSLTTGKYNRPRSLEALEDFFKLFTRLGAVIIVSYAGVYCGLISLMSPTTVFHGVSSGWGEDLKLLYFSVVTIATVGYGDIYPVTALARFAVASQILAGFSLFVLLLTAFTFVPDESPASEERHEIHE